MITSNRMFVQSQLAEAAYADLWDSGTGTFITNSEAVKQRLINMQPDGTYDFSTSQASDFVTHWEVVHHLPNTDSGFSGTVFRRRDDDPVSGLKASDLVFALRGTEQLGLDLFQADFNELVKNGLAFRQIIDMYNYWQRLITPAGESARQAMLVPAPSGTPDDRVIDESGEKWTIDFYSVAGLGKVDLTDNLVAATGHSLGGHLATAFTRLFSGWTSEAVTFNGAGYPTGALPGLSLTAANNIPNLFSMLGGNASFPTAGITNLYGDKNLELVTMNNFFGLMQPGEHQPLFIEQDTVYASTFGHGMGQMADSAAVFDLLVRMDDSLSNATAETVTTKLNPLFEAVSPMRGRSLENLLNALAELFNTGVEIGDAQTNQREALYLAIDALRKDPDFIRTEGLLDVQALTSLSRNTLVSRAKQNSAEGLAHRYALANLNSFALSGDTALYATHNANGELDLYNRSTGLGQLTDPYLKDRAYMLTRLIESHLEDKAYVSIINGQQEYFYDYAQDNEVLTTNFATVLLGRTEPLVEHPAVRTNITNYIFGDESGNTFAGGNLGDHLYGGAGDDVIHAQGGADYLEGNDGNDTLAAGDGANRVLGGAGHDIITAGQDADILLGGAGRDDVSAGGGNDLVYGGADLDLLYGEAGNDFLNGGSGVDVLSGGADNDLVYDQGGGNEPNTLKGDGGNDVLELGAGTGIGTLEGDDGNDVIFSRSTGDGTLDGGSGNDVIAGGAGKETILGGAGADNLDGDSGNDTLDGGAGADYLRGGAGHDVITAGQGSDLIVDADGVLKAGDGTPLTGGGYDENALAHVGGGYEYRKISLGDFDALMINAQGDSLNTVFIDHWVDGQLGISLSGQENTPTMPAVTLTPVNSLAINNYVDWIDGDSADGGQGNDILIGSDVPSVLAGGTGNDVLDGRAGDDWLVGGDDNDWLLMGDGDDVAYGGSGDDVITTQLGYKYTVWTDLDTSSIFYYYVEDIRYNIAHPELANFNFSITSKIGVGENYIGQMFWTNVGSTSVNLEPGLTVTWTWGDAQMVYRGARLTAANAPDENLGKPVDYTSDWHGNLGTLTVTGLKRAWGGIGNDILYGANDSDMLYGEAGDDLLIGYNGADRLYGGDGIDELSGGKGRDVLDGGSEDDFMDGGLGADVLNGGTGNDRMVGDAPYLLGANGYPAGLDVSQMGGDLMYGGAGVDKIWGNHGDDYLYGGTEQDTLYGGMDNDHLFGEDGEDRLDGGGGDDYLDGGADNDEVYDDDGKDILYGGAGDDQLDGGKDDDILDGGTENDVLTGGDGADILRGGAGNDHLYGDTGGSAPGADILDGGAGNDELNGGGGSDMYVFNLGDGKDIVQDDGANGSVNAIVFKFNQSEVKKVERNGADLVITYGSAATDSVTVTGYYRGGFNTGFEWAAPRTGDGEAQNTVAHIGFDDGTIWTSEDIYRLAPPSSTPIADPFADAKLPYFIDALISRDEVRSAGKHTLTYSFAESYSAGEQNIYAYTSAQKDAVHAALARFSDVIDVSFTEVADDQNADLRYFLDDLSNVSKGGFAGYANSATGEIHINSMLFARVFEDEFGNYATRQSLDVGQSGFEVLLHETGHALGLKHPFEAPLLPDAEDNNANTMMSYTRATGPATQLGTFDTAALQYLYGIAKNQRAGNDTYTFADKYIQDTGGHDTFDAGAETQDVLIDLAEGGWSALRIKENSILAAGQTFTGYGSAIEDAVGGTGNDIISGNALTNVLIGGDGADSLSGLTGNDLLRGGAGDDVYLFNPGDGLDTIDNTDLMGATDTLRFGAGITDGDVLAFRSGTDMHIKIRGTTDSIFFGNYYGEDIGSTGAISDRKLDRVEFADGVTWDQAMIQNRVDRAANNQTPTVNKELPTLETRMGELFSYTAPIDTITDPDPWDSVTYSATMADGSALPAWLNFDAASRTFSGRPDPANVGSVELALVGTDIYGAAVVESFVLNVTQDMIIVGTTGNDTLNGGLGNDILMGLAGNDVLNGGEGADAMQGGLGSDTYMVDSDLDSLTENANEGMDSVQSSISFILPSNIEHLTLIGSMAIDGTGNTLSNMLQGNAGDNVLVGGVGADVLYGGDGADTLLGGADADALYGETGDDALHGDDADDSLYGGAGNDVMNGGQGADTLYGEDGNDDLHGGAGTDTLQGGDGDDTLAGGAGDDIYVLNGGSDTVIENADEGSDTVESTIFYALENNVENLILTGVSRLEGTGNDLDNTIRANDAGNGLFGMAGDDRLYGGQGDDVLDGGGGSDVMLGGRGDDVYRVDDAADSVREDEGALQYAVEQFGTNAYTIEIVGQSGGGYTDTVEAAVSYRLEDRFENLVLTGAEAIDGTGNDFQNIITGNDADNILRGDGSPSSSLPYFDEEENQLRDRFLRALDEGVINNNQSYLSVEFAPGAGDELDGRGGDDRLIGDLGNDTLLGGDGNDTLEGGMGRDTLIGGAGDDLYIVDRRDIVISGLDARVRMVDPGDDALVETANQGSDTVQSGYDFTLAEHFEHLVLVGQAHRGTGNAADNQLTARNAGSELYGLAGDDTLIGGMGGNILDGGSGADTLRGDGGDTYIVDDIGDQVVESAFYGVDVVKSSVDYTLGANLEQLFLTGAALEGAGNELSNVIVGNAGGNLLNGAGGDDMIEGEDGADVIDGGEGADRLYGGADDDSLRGGHGADRLDGGTGADIMDGGNGDDEYIVDAAEDVTDEGSGDGHDTVYASVTHTLARGIEDLHLTGDAPADGTGNELDNFILGNHLSNSLSGLDGNDTLNGGWGDLDTLAGGAGDDHYVVHNIGDVIIENVGEGLDSVESDTSYALSSNVEDLRLLGDFSENGRVDALAGSGNELDNQITGNDGDNVLYALGGSDRIDARAGNDTVEGGAGDDVLYGGDDALYEQACFSESASNEPAEISAFFTIEPLPTGLSPTPGRQCRYPARR